MYLSIYTIHTSTDAVEIPYVRLRAFQFLSKYNKPQRMPLAIFVLHNGVQPFQCGLLQVSDICVLFIFLHSLVLEACDIFAKFLILVKKHNYENYVTSVSLFL
jgi:hypothetical protein